MKVYIIGAGPEDPKLITVRGAELIEQCQVVLYTGFSGLLTIVVICYISICLNLKHKTLYSCAVTTLYIY